MSETASICSLTVSKTRDVTLSYDNKEYTSKVSTDRRLRLVVERFDRLAKEHQEVCRHEDLVLLGDTLFGLLFGQTAAQMFASDSGVRSTTPLDGKTLGDVFLGIVDAHKAGGCTTRLRLDLVFEEGTDTWASLPWEFLYAFRPNNAGFFIAGIGASLSLTRFISRHPNDTNRQTQHICS